MMKKKKKVFFLETLPSVNHEGAVNPFPNLETNIFLVGSHMALTPSNFSETHHPVGSTFSSYLFARSKAGGPVFLNFLSWEDGVSSSSSSSSLLGLRFLDLEGGEEEEVGWP